MENPSKCDLERFVRIAKSANWHFAKTAAKTNPHWYMLRKEFCNDEDYYWFYEFINKYGSDEWFWRRKYKVLYVGDYKYWNIPWSEGDDPYLINRTISDKEEYNKLILKANQ